MQNSCICGCNAWKSFKRFITGLGYYLKPFAKMCAKYLLSFERRATDYLAFRPRFFIMTKINNSSKDLECLGSAL